jgi:hypothetical protein
MIAPLAVALCVLSQTEGSAAADSDTLPSSFAMYVSFAEPQITAGGSTAISATVRAGAVLAGQHALLVGVSFGSAFASASPGTTLMFLPTYRFYFRELAAKQFSAFAEGHIFVGYTYSSAGGGGLGTHSVPFGVGGGFGGEYLITRNFGFAGGAGLRFVHSETSFAGTVASYSNMIGIWAFAQLALHF